LGVSIIFEEDPILFGLGAISRPMMAAEKVSFIGHHGKIWFAGTDHLALMEFTISRIFGRRAFSMPEKGAVVSVPRTDGLPAGSSFEST
jgi:hypothetical protein